MGQWIIYGEAPGEVVQAVGKLSACIGSDSWCYSHQVPEVDRWEDLGLIARLGDRVVPGPRIVCLSSVLVSEMSGVLERAIALYTAYLADEGISRLRAAAGLVPDDHGYEWRRLEHILVLGMLMDMGVRYSALRRGLIQSQPDSFWVWRFPETSDRGFDFGVRIVPSQYHCGVAQLWYEGSGVSAVSLGPGEMDIVRSMLAGDQPVGAQHQYLRLQYWHVIRQSTHGPHLCVPVIKCHRGDNLWDSIEQTAGKIVSDVYVPFLEDRAVTGCTAGERQALMRLLMTRVAAGILDGGVLSRPPTKDRAHGIWVWCEQPGFLPMTAPASAAGSSGDGLVS